jgi:hypothetical protein
MALLPMVIEERKARRGNLYKTRNAPFYTEIANNGRFTRSPRNRLVAMLFVHSRFIKVIANAARL